MEPCNGDMPHTLLQAARQKLEGLAGELRSRTGPVLTIDSPHSPTVPLPWLCRHVLQATCRSWRKHGRLAKPTTVGLTATLRHRQHRAVLARGFPDARCDVMRVLSLRGFAR